MIAGWDLLLWALLLAGVVLWILLQRFLRKRRPRGDALPPEPAAPPPSAPARPARAEPDPFDPRWGRAPALVEVPVPAPLVQPVVRQPARAAPGARSPRRARWGSRAAVRRAFADAVVLGPPRALQPWDGGHDATGAGLARRP